MFTGIIEEVGLVKSFKLLSSGAEIEIECHKVLENTNIGDSISINGVCETVTKISYNAFTAKISPETLSVTTFNSIRTSDSVNLERALTLNSRLGGHIISGHVDCVGELKDIEKLTEFYNLTFEIPTIQAKYIIYKGSVTINGISLTVANIIDNFVSVAIIPHTFNSTNLKNLKIGNKVNIETDILARYVEKLISVSNNKNGSISLEFLVQNGFM